MALWTSNFGPHTLQRENRLVDGRDEEIQTLGYGYHVTPSPTADACNDRRDTYR